MRLIDADVLMGHLSDWALHDNATEIRECMKAVKEQPTVDKINICKNCRWARLAAGFVKHGRWEEREVIEQEMSNIEDWQSARCSVCGKYHTTPYLYGFKDYEYCPHCGARMDEVEE